MAALKAIYFDIDDTLYSTSRFAERARRSAVEAMVRTGLRADPEVVYRELVEVIQEFSPNHGHHFDKLLHRFPAKTWSPTNPALIVAAGVVAYHETKARELEPFAGVRQLMEALAGSDLVRGVITHGQTIKQAEKLIRLDIHRFLTPGALFISDQVGISKPNPKIYLRALEAAGLPPESAMYVGDNPLTDIDPPNRLGMITVRHRWPGKYADLAGETEPDHEIHAFVELQPILRERYGVRI